MTCSIYQRPRCATRWPCLALGLAASISLLIPREALASPLFDAPFMSFDTGVYPYSVAVADLNGDGRQDLAIANSSDNSVSILLGRGDGTFSPRQDYSVGAAPHSVAIGDLNGDGWPDVVTANSATVTISVLL